MNVTILSAGSRGDVQPFVALGVGLARAGHRVRLAAAASAQEVVVPLDITDAVPPGVVSLPHGYGHDRPGIRLSVARQWPGASANDVTDAGAIDPLTGTACFNGVPVRVHPEPPASSLGAGPEAAAVPADEGGLRR